MKENELKYLIALTLIPHVGSITARKLIAYIGSAEAVFRESPGVLRKIPGIGEFLARQKNTPGLIEKAEKELNFIKKNNISYLTLFCNAYPERLKQCADAPLIIYFKGENIFNYQMMLSVVGTRKATNYGIECCNRIINDLAHQNLNVVIVSGLAYGIDYQAHLAALKSGLKTIAVLAHGLHTLYPHMHRKIASEIKNNGALLTDFTSNGNPERNNFLKRNRIIAGLSDATLVIESGINGGALITAEFAGEYNRDVFALPGRVNDKMSEGCNRLIKDNRASLIESASDIQYFLGWKENNPENLPRQRHLFNDLSDEEAGIVEILAFEESLPVDIISIKMKMPVSKISSLLLGLEFNGIIKALPGNYYKLI